jgi:hypothetical protein
VGSAHPSVIFGWVGASWQRPPKSHGKKLKIDKKEINEFFIIIIQ